jgi:hypothetical protein
MHIFNITLHLTLPRLSDMLLAFAVFSAFALEFAMIARLLRLSFVC